MRRFEDIYFAQEREAQPLAILLENEGSRAVLDYLDGAGLLLADGETRDEPPAGDGDDRILTPGPDGHPYEIAYNSRIPYIGICRIHTED